MDTTTKPATIQKVDEDVLTKAVIAAFAHVRHSATDADVQLISKDCRWWLDRKGKGMNNEDVVSAMKYGSLGELGDFTFINSKTAIGWLRAWQTSPDRFAVKRPPIPVTHQLSDSATVTEETKRIQDMAFIERSVGEYLEKGRFIDYGNLLYNLARRYKLINVNDELWHMACAMVRLDQIMEAKAKKARNEIGTKQLGETIDRFLSMGVDKQKYNTRHKIVQLWLAEIKKVSTAAKGGRP